MHNIRSFLGKKSLFVFLELVGLVCLLSIAGHVAVTLHEDSTTKIQAKKVVWSLGEADGTADEFAGQDQLVQTVTIPSGVTLKETTRKVPSGLNKLSNSELSIAYRLDSIPKYGVMLRVKILDAYKAIPQMAVFSNQQLSGIVQIAGVDGTESKYPFIKTYSL